VGACHAVLTSSSLSYLITCRTQALNAALLASLRLLKQSVEHYEAEESKRREEASTGTESSQTQALNQSQTPSLIQTLTVPSLNPTPPSLNLTVIPQPLNQTPPSMNPTPPSSNPTPSLNPTAPSLILARSGKVKPEIEAFAFAAIETYLRAKGRGEDERRVLQFFVDEALELGLALLSLDLKASCADGEGLNHKLRELLEKVLFGPEQKVHYEGFIDAYMVEDEAKPKKPIIKSIFSKLKTAMLADPKIVLDLALNGLKTLKLNEKWRFQGVRILISDVLAKKEATSTDVTVLSVAMDHIYRENLVDLFDDKTRETLRRVRDVGLAFLKDGQVSEELYYLLMNLLRSEPQILEESKGVMKNILKSLLVEEFLGKAKEEFISFLVGFWKKLRRLDKLFLHMQSAILDLGESACSVSFSLQFMKPIEEAGVDLPLGTALTIWEDLHESQEKLISNCNSKTQHSQLSLLVSLEIAFLQKLILANHNNPESLSLNIQSCLEVMGKIKMEMDAIELNSDFKDLYAKTYLKLRSILSFYLPKRHSGCVKVFNSVDLNDTEAAFESLLMFNWMPLRATDIVSKDSDTDSSFLEKWVIHALENSSCEKHFQLLTDESNYEIPGYVGILFNTIQNDLELSISSKDANMIYIQVLMKIPLQLVSVEKLGETLTILFKMSSYVQCQNDADLLITLTDSIISDLPKTAEVFLQKLSSFTMIIESFAHLCSNFSINDKVQSLTSKVTKMSLNLTKFQEVCESLRKILCRFVNQLGSMEKKFHETETLLYIILPVFVATYHRLTKLHHQSNSSDELKIEVSSLTSVFGMTIDTLIHQYVDNESVESSPSLLLMALKTLFITFEKALSLSMHDIQFEELPVILFKKYEQLDPMCLSLEEKLAYFQCLKVILGKEGYARKFFAETKRNFSFYLDSILGLLKKPTKVIETKEMTEINHEQLPTEDFNLMDRFLGSSMETEETPEQPSGSDVSKSLEDTRSDAGFTDISDIKDVTFDDHNTSQILLSCLNLLKKYSPSPLFIQKQLVSNITISTVESNPALLDMAITFCLDADKIGKSSHNLALDPQAARLFVESILNLSAGLSQIEDCLTSNHEKAIISITKFLDKLVRAPKKLIDATSIHVTSVAVEMLIHLPVPYDNSTKYFHHVSNIINSLLTQRLSQVFKMAPTFFMTIDKLLKLLCFMVNKASEIPVTDLRDSANSLSRICALLRPHKAELSKLAPYWISHFTHALANTTFGDSRVKRDVDMCAFSLMDICDDFGFDLLRTWLQPNEKEIFRLLKGDYEKSFKFMGKI